MPQGFLLQPVKLQGWAPERKCVAQLGRVLYHQGPALSSQLAGPRAGQGWGWGCQLQEPSPRPEQPDGAGSGPSARQSSNRAPAAFVPFIPVADFPRHLQRGLGSTWARKGLPRDLVLLPQGGVQLVALREGPQNSKENNQTSVRLGALNCQLGVTPITLWREDLVPSPALQMRKRRHTEVKGPGQGHTAEEVQTVGALESTNLSPAGLGQGIHIY